MNRLFARLQTVEKQTCYLLTNRQTFLTPFTNKPIENKLNYSKMATGKSVYVTRPDVAAIGLDLLKKE